MSPTVHKVSIHDAQVISNVVSPTRIDKLLSGAVEVRNIGGLIQNVPSLLYQYQQV